MTRTILISFVLSIFYMIITLAVMLVMLMFANALKTIISKLYESICNEIYRFISGAGDE
ncbi:hypothetical protein [Melioribacter sp. OK-6-Me]|uniref:hypothetical protein n=1 Tax=unclassified Melioribacter TaxID=2627329 RepID=UPI003EDB2706